MLGHLFITTQKVELVIDIAAFTAQAGQIKVFAEKGYRVIAIDFHFFGIITNITDCHFPCVQANADSDFKAGTTITRDVRLGNRRT